MSKLEIRVEKVTGKTPVTVIHVKGDVDASSHQELDAKAESLIKDGARHILLDLTDNKYMSSAGFRSMHRIYKSLQDSGDKTSSVKLLNPTDEVKRLMKAMGFDVFFSTYSDMKEAIKAF